MRQINSSYLQVWCDATYTDGQLRSVLHTKALIQGDEEYIDSFELHGD